MKNTKKIQSLVEESNKEMTEGNWIEAIKILRELIKIFPDSTPLLTNISLSLANTKSFDEAHQNIDQANKNEPLNVTTKYVKAYCFELEEKFDDAIDGYKKCLKINKEHKDSWIRIAIISRKQSKYDDALNIYKHIFSKIIKDPNILTDMGITLYEKGDLNKAEEILKRRLSIDENSIITKQFLSKIYHQDINKKQLAVELDKEIDGLIEL